MVESVELLNGSSRAKFKFKKVKIMQRKQFRRREKPQNLAVEPQDFMASIIGISSPLGEKLFRHGAAFKGTHPALSDALQVSGIILAFNNR